MDEFNETSVGTDAENPIPGTIDTLTEAKPVDVCDDEPKTKRAYFAKMGWRYALGLGLIIVAQLFMSVILLIIGNVNPGFAGFLEKNAWINYLQIIIPVDLFGLPLIYLISKSVDKVEIEKKKLKVGTVILLILVAYGVVLVGNLIGQVVHAAVVLPFGINPLETNVLGNLLTGDTSAAYIIWGFIAAGIGAPIVEELIFRKILIDRTMKYGVAPAILLSSLLFGLYHGNFNQFFYAFFLGVLFAYVYAYTGNVIYTIILHMAVNMYSSGLLVAVTAFQDPAISETINTAVSNFSQTRDVNAYMEAINNILSTNPGGMVAYLAYDAVVIFMLLLEIAGIIVILCNIRKAWRLRKTMNLGHGGGRKAAVFNWGSILAILICLGLFFFTYVGIILSALFPAAP